MKLEEDLLSPGAAAPLRRRQGRLGECGTPPRRPPLHSPPPLWRGIALAGDGRHHRRGHRYLAEEA